MVTSELSQTQILGNPGEHFIGKILPGSKFSNCKLAPEEIKQEINRILEKAKTSNGVISIKIMSNYILEIAKAIEKIKEPKDSSFSDKYNRKAYLQQLFIEFFNDLDIDGNFVAIRVYRKNKLKQAVSRFVAGETGLYHIVKDEQGGLMNQYDRSPQEAKPFRLNLDKSYNYEKIASKIDSIYEEEKELEVLFDNFKISPINLIYEDIVRDTRYIGNIVSQISYLKNYSRVNDVQRKTVKTASSINQEVCNRFKKDGKYKKKFNPIIDEKSNLIKHFYRLPPHTTYSELFFSSKFVDIKLDSLHLNSQNSNLIVGGIIISHEDITNIFLLDNHTKEKYEAKINLKSDYFASLYWGINQSSHARFKCIVPLKDCNFANVQERYILDLNYVAKNSSPTPIAQINISHFLNKSLQSSQYSIK